MRKILALLCAAALVPACRTTGSRVRETSEVVALVVRTEPAGAKVRVEKVDREWTAPCDVADPAIRRGRLDVTVSLEGHETVTRRVSWDGEVPARLELRLVPKTGTIVVQGAAPGARVLLLRGPAGAIGFWSENEETVKAAVAAKKEGEGRESMTVAHRVTADAAGTARLTYVPSTGTLHLLVTHPGGADFVKTDVKAEVKGTLTITVPAAPKPAVEAAPAVAAAPLAKLTVKAAGDRVRVTAGGKVVADVPTHPDESVKLTVPREKVLVEFLDAKTGAVTGSVELVPEAEAAVAPAPGDPERIGKLQLVHPRFGIFVKLEPGQEIAIGDVVTLHREGREVVRAKVVRVCAGDAGYPAGAAMLSAEAAAGRKGDEARRAKP